jgi:hypothetical protein
MALLDKELEFSDAQAVTATAASTNVIDMTVAAPNIGRGQEPIYAQVQVNTTADASGSATVTFTLEDSADNSSYSAVYTTAAIGKATLVAGYIVFTVALPATLRRYIRVNYTVATGPLTAGKFDAYLTTGPLK